VGKKSVLRAVAQTLLSKRIVLVVDPSSTYAETATNSARNFSTYDITRDIPVWALLNRFLSLSAA
jgi:hypothetical protein